MTSFESSDHIISYWKLEWDETSKQLSVRFICYWISLNAWYGTNLTPVPLGTRDYITDDQYIKELKNIIKAKWIDWTLEIASAKKLKPRLKNPTRPSRPWLMVHDLETLIDFVYRVRNNLFHWNKADTDSRDNTILVIALPILEKILNSCI